MIDPRTVANAYVRTLLAAVEAQGVPVARVLQGLPVDEAGLAAPHGRLNVTLVRRIWEQALSLSGDPLLGLKVAGAMRPSTFRVLGLAVMSAASLAEALGIMLRYHRLVSEAGTLSAQPGADGNMTIVYTEQPLRHPLLPAQVEAIVAGMVHQARWLSGRELAPVRIAFRHAPQGNAAEYRRLLGILPCFGADADLLELAAADLGLPLPHADAELCRLHCELADRQLAGLPPVGVVTGFAVQWLSARPSGAMRIGDLAQALGVSVRSLQRQLQAEGHGWTTVVDAARREGFVDLQRQGLSLEAMAQRLGYHDASSLSRAVKRWFGQTPGSLALSP